MNAKDCRAVRREIDQSELGQRLSDNVLGHVAACATCRDFSDQRSRLRELVGSLEPVTAPADFDVRLRARIAHEKENSARQPLFFRFVMSTPAIAVAAALVMLVGSIFWLSQRNRIESSPASATNPNKAAAGTNAPSVAVNTGGSATTQPEPATIAAAEKSNRSNVSRQNLAKASTVIASGPNSSDFSVSRAPAIRQTEQRPGEVSLTAPMKPMVVSMQDDQGARRRILLPPISFGSQRLVDNRVPVSMNNSRDW